MFPKIEQQKKKNKIDLELKKGAKVKESLNISIPEMSWLRSSPMRQSFTRRSQDISSSSSADQKAVSDSFSNHWMQIQQIINRSEVKNIDNMPIALND